jgi:predicted dehydrogenase
MTLANLGFVGCGTHATNNLYPMLRYARCQLDCVCDLREDLAARNATLFGAAAHFTDAARMLGERKVDGLIVVGPPKLHYDVGRLALARGIPVLVEKPTAPTLEQTAELVELARRNRTFVMTGFMKRFGMAYKKARDLIARHEFTPSAGLFRYGHWAVGDLRNMLLFMCVHPLDLAVSYFGEVASLHSALYRSERNGLSLAVTLRFESGRWAQLMLDSSQPRIQERIELSGAMGGNNALIVVDNVEHMELHRQGQRGVDLLQPNLWEIAPEFDLADISVWRPDYGIPNMGQTRHFFQGFAGEIREFADAILERREPYPPMDEAVHVMEIVEAICARPDGVSDL